MAHPPPEIREVIRMAVRHRQYFREPRVREFDASAAAVNLDALR
jgi:hypothetical protein